MAITEKIQTFITFLFWILRKSLFFGFIILIVYGQFRFGIAFFLSWLLIAMVEFDWNVAWKEKFTLQNIKKYFKKYIDDVLDFINNFDVSKLINFIKGTFIDWFEIAEAIKRNGKEMEKEIGNYDGNLEKENISGDRTLVAFISKNINRLSLLRIGIEICYALVVGSLVAYIIFGAHAATKTFAGIALSDWYLLFVPFPSAPFFVVRRYLYKKHRTIMIPKSSTNIWDVINETQNWLYALITILISITFSSIITLSSFVVSLIIFQLIIFSLIIIFTNLDLF